MVIDHEARVSKPDGVTILMAGSSRAKFAIILLHFQSNQKKDLGQVWMGLLLFYL